MVAAVATEEPEIAAKILQERMVAIARPPGKFPTQACAKPNRSSPTPAFNKMFEEPLVVRYLPVASILNL